MKKKILTAVLSMVLCLGMSVTAMAAPSPNGGAGAEKPVEGTGTVTAGSRDNYSEEATKTVADFYSEAEAVIKAAIEAGFDWNTASDEEKTEMNTKAYAPLFQNHGITFTKINACWEIALDGDAVGWKRVPNTYADQFRGTPYIVHVDNDKMEYLETKVYGNEVWAKFNGKFSPFFAVDGEMPAAEVPAHYHNYGTLVVAPTETTWGYTTHYCACGYEYHDTYVAPTNGAAAAAANTTVTSPKTAENALPFVMAVVAVAAIGGAVVVARRKYTA